MIKKHLSFIPIHIIITFFLLFGTYMSSGSPTPFQPIRMWFFLVIIFFPLAHVGNLHLLIVNRGQENNLKFFLVALPIMFLPYLILLFLMLRM